MIDIDSQGFSTWKVLLLTGLIKSKTHILKHVWQFGKFRKQFIVTVLVHLAETMKRIFVPLSRHWRKLYVNDGDQENDKY